MNKALAVATAEYINAVRSKGFILGLAILPIALGAMILIQKLATSTADLSDRKFAIVDFTGKLADPLTEAATHYNENEIFTPDDEGNPVQSKPKWALEIVQAPDDLDYRIDADLSDRTRNNEIFAFAIIPADILDPESGSRISYYTQNPSYNDLPNWLRAATTHIAREVRLGESQIDPQVVEQVSLANRGVDLRHLGLVERASTGEVSDASEGNQAATFLLPVVGMFLIFMLVMTVCPPMLNAVLEEKMQRIAELLVSSITPLELMFGKLLGGVFVALSLAVLYVAGGIYLADMYNVTNLLTPAYLGWFAAFMLLALFMYGSMFVAIGSACSEIRDSQALMTPAMILTMMPLWCWFIVVQDPNSTAATALSLFPPFTPMLMFLRIGASPAPPMWQVVLSFFLTSGFTFLCVWGSARIFRIGILSYGQAPSFRKLLVWAISGK